MSEQHLAGLRVRRSSTVWSTPSTRDRHTLASTKYPVPPFPGGPTPKVGEIAAMTVAEQAAEGTTRKAHPHPRAHHRDRLLRTRDGHRASEAGRRLPDPGEGRQRRRHLARQHLPGCACDIPSHLYSFSFEPKPDWRKCFRPQPEIWTTSRASPTSTGCAVTSASARMSTARTGMTPSTAGTSSPRPARSTSRSS